MSTSKLQEYTARLLYQSLGAYTIKENYRPDWLTSENGERLELDLYVPELSVAIEVQGAQHYTFTPFFHKNHDGFKQGLERDKIKRAICEHRGIRLFEVSSPQDLLDIIESIYPKQEQDFTPDAAVIENQKQSIRDNGILLKIKHCKRKLTKELKRDTPNLSRIEQLENQIRKYAMS